MQRNLHARHDGMTAASKEGADRYWELAPRQTSNERRWGRNDQANTCSSFFRNHVGSLIRLTDAVLLSVEAIADGAEETSPRPLGRTAWCWHQLLSSASTCRASRRRSKAAMRPSLRSRLPILCPTRGKGDRLLQRAVRGWRPRCSDALARHGGRSRIIDQTTKIANPGRVRLLPKPAARPG